MNGVDASDAALFPGALAPFRSMLVWDRDDAAPVLDRAALLDVLARYQRSVDGPWQPACSLWAQVYFNTLLIPATCLLAHDADLIRRVADAGVTLCPVSGRPLRCALKTVDPESRRAGGGLAARLARHAEAVIGELNAVSRLSHAMLRESAERAVAWTLTEMSLADPARARAARGRLAQGGWPLARRGEDGTLEARRFCCLRDRLPNVAPCGDICPRRNGLPRAARAGNRTGDAGEAQAARGEDGRRSVPPLSA